MDKRSPKSPLLYERYKSGCAWGLIGLCDFGQGHSNKKLISNRGGLNSHFLDDSHIKNRVGLLSNSHEKCHCIDDGINKTLTKDSAKADIIREEEMATRQQINKKISTSRVNHVQSDSQPAGRFAKNHRRKANKTFQIHGCKDISTVVHTQSSYENSEGPSSKMFNTAALTETSCNQVHPKNGRDCSRTSISYQKNDQLSEINFQVKMNEAAEAFINQKLVHGKYLGRDRASHQSKHFLDALEILNSNKELFIKLLQDPNSLLVKHIQDLRDSQEKEQDTRSFSETKLSETSRSSAKGCKEPASTQKSCDGYPSKGSGDPQPSDRIVVLKSGSACMQNSAGEISDCSSPQSLYSLRHKAESGKPAYFSFEHMKRKLRHAIGLSKKKKPLSSTVTLHKSSKDIQGLGDGSKGNDLEIGESNSLCKISLGIHGMEKSHSDVSRKDKVDKMEDFESGTRQEVALNSESGHQNSKLSIVRHLEQRESNVYNGSRKYLSEVLSYRNEAFLRKQFPKTLGRISSLPEYDFLFALSPARHWEHDSIAAQMRFSPYNNYQMVNEKTKMLQIENKNNYLSPLRQIVQASSRADNKILTHRSQISDAKPNISENHFSDIKVQENISSTHYSSSPTGSLKIVRTHNTVKGGEVSCLRMPSEANGPHNNGANQSATTANAFEEKPYLECLKLDSPEENCTSPSPDDVYTSSPLSIKNLEDSDGMKDKAEHPSPTSVLEQFVEDITSPPSIISQSAELAYEPKQNNYEEHYSGAVETSPKDLKINSIGVMDEHESMSKYIKAVLQASGINWDKLLMKCHSSDQILEPSLLYEVELLPNQYCGDHRLLFDYVNDVLVEVYQSCSPWLSFGKKKIQPFQAGENMVYEVMKHVDWHLLSPQSSPTLEQLVQKDLAKSITWMDVRIDMEDTVSEVVENLLEDLTTETAIHLSI